MHEHYTYADNGDTVDAFSLCSDSCNQEYAGDDYEGWNGCHESEFTTWCVNCGVVIPGESACECQIRNVVVNRFLSKDGEQCQHGNWIQLPASLLNV
jgi:hypothetical protein